ncbi:MAG: hypothetical protein J6P79_05025 [Pseudobutyrivibrio sp.]|nr:hypothetical protein [Pseudobutyrivibrio sp.]
MRALVVARKMIGLVMIALLTTIIMSSMFESKGLTLSKKTVGINGTIGNGIESIQEEHIIKTDLNAEKNSDGTFTLKINPTNERYINIIQFSSEDNLLCYEWKDFLKSAYEELTLIYKQGRDGEWDSHFFEKNKNICSIMDRFECNGNGKRDKVEL